MKCETTTMDRQIKKLIKKRIVICLVFILITTSTYTAIIMLNMIDKLQTSTNTNSKYLAKYAISLVYFDSNSYKKNSSVEKIVIAKFQQLEKTNPYHANIQWIRSNEITRQKYSLSFPAFINFYVPVKTSGIQHQYGYFRITYDLRNLKDIFEEIIISSILLLFLLACVLFILIPLSSRIPNELFVKPINRILTLLEGNDNNLEFSGISGIATKESQVIEKKIKLLLHDSKRKLLRKLMHDLQSPFSSLKQIVKSGRALDAKNIYSSLQFSTNSISLIIQSMRNILNDQNDRKTLCALPLIKTIENNLHLKRIEYAKSCFSIHLNVDTSLDSRYLLCEPAGFERALSNLIHNAFEASNGSGDVYVSLGENDASLWLEIQDNTGGMKQSVLDVLNMGEHITTKKSGHGLGTAQVKDFINSVNGKLSYSNNNLHGVSVSIELPIRFVMHPSIITAISIRNKNHLVVFSTDASRKNKWNSLIKASHMNIPLICISTLEMFQNQLASDTSNFLFFIDFNLGENMNTLELVKHCDLVNRSFLVINGSLTKTLLDECLIYGINLIPLSLLEMLTFHMTN